MSTAWYLGSHLERQNEARHAIGRCGTVKASWIMASPGEGPATVPSCRLPRKQSLLWQSGAQAGSPARLRRCHLYLSRLLMSRPSILPVNASIPTQYRVAAAGTTVALG